MPFAALKTGLPERFVYAWLYPHCHTLKNAPKSFLTQKAGKARRYWVSGI
jgi:hypothetical protein